MIKIINEIDGKRYELVGDTHICDGCVFLREDVYGCDDIPKFNRVAICAKLHGIWKEIKDED